MQPNLLIIYDNPPSYRERSFWSSPKEYEDNRLWLIREAHKIISFPALKERVANIYELFVYAFEDIQVFSHPASYFVSDHPAYIKKPLCGLTEFLLISWLSWEEKWSTLWLKDAVRVLAMQFRWFGRLFRFGASVCTGMNCRMFQVRLKMPCVFIPTRTMPAPFSSYMQYLGVAFFYQAVDKPS